MNRRTNLKAVPREKREPLTREQFVALARAISDTLADADDREATRALLLLADEMVHFCQEWSHVEAIGSALKDEVFAQSFEYGYALEGYIDGERAKLQKGGEGR
jgi:hypothetical protein